jgi:cytoskeletal protein CcmA (bactofilin family)
MNDASVIGRETVVRGSVRGQGSLEILGRVDGDVSVTGDVTLGEDAAVKGNLSGVRVTVAGAVQGDVRGSEAVTLEPGARVVGDLTAPKVGVMAGALVRGLVRTDGEPTLTQGRRAQPVQAARPVAFVPKPVMAAQQPRPEPDDEDDEDDEDHAPDSDDVPESQPVRAAREAPPPPVAPTLAKGAKAKKKKKD